MPDELKRRDFLATSAALGGTLVTATPSQGAADPKACPNDPRCPYFDQPLFCGGERFCEK